jgi:hypothetical protein
MTMVAAISATSFTAVLYSFFGVDIKIAAFAAALFAIPFYIISFKMGNKFGYEMRKWRNRYIDYAIWFESLSYEEQELVLETYLKGNLDKVVFNKLKTVTYKLTKKPLLFVEPDGRATFTLLKVGNLSHPIPYLMS